jgi:MFS family permease
MSMNVWRVAGVLCLIAVEALLYGYSYPFFSLALEKRELANWLIGLNASLAGAGVLIVGPLLPGLIARFGVRVLVAGLFAISIVSFAAILLLSDYLLVWFVARFVLGACFAALWTASEIWLNGVVNDRHRGRIIGASGTLYATCQFLGPLALGEVGVGGSLPLIVAMAPLAIGVLVALSTRPGRRERDEEEGLGDPKSLRLALSVAGGLVAAAFLGGIGKTAMQSLLPIYGLAHGFDDAGAARLVAVFILGEAVLVAGLGWMADRFGHRLTLGACVLAAALSTLAISFSTGSVLLLWPLLFLAGGTVAGVYTLGIVVIGRDFRGHKLAVVSSGFAVAYSAGSIVGTAPVGYLIDLFGPEALPLAVGISFVGLSTYLFVGDDSEARIGRELQPAVPNLKYLEDSQFEEDEVTAAAEPAEAAPEQGPFSEANPFRPAPPRAELEMPLENLEQQIKRRRADIAEIVTRRRESRETQQNRTRPQPAKEPSEAPKASPFAPLPRPENGGPERC